MKCPKCDGTRKTYRASVDLYSRCDECRGTGTIMKTNEEWFDTLSTKEKAKVLDLLMDGMSNLRFEIEEILNNDLDMTNEEAVEIWLRQPHHKEK